MFLFHRIVHQYGRILLTKPQNFINVSSKIFQLVMFRTNSQTESKCTFDSHVNHSSVLISISFGLFLYLSVALRFSHRVIHCSVIMHWSVIGDFSTNFAWWYLLVVQILNFMSKCSWLMTLTLFQDHMEWWMSETWER